MRHQLRRLALLSIAAVAAGFGSAAIVGFGVLAGPHLTAYPQPDLPPEQPPPPAVPDPPAPPETIQALPNPNDAVEATFAAARVLTAAGHGPDLPFLRWIWVQSGDVEDAAACNVVLNLDSRDVFSHPSLILKGRAMLVQVDLRDYAPRQGGGFDDLADWIRIWDDFQFDPMFSLLLTRDTLRFVNIPVADLPKVKKTVKKTVVRKEPYKKKVTKQVTVKINPYIDQYGRYHDTTVREQEVEEDAEREVTEEVSNEIEIPITESPDFAVVRLNSRGVSREHLLALQDLTGSQAPIVSDSYFLSRASSTIKDDKVNPVFATIWGGRYYDLRGIKKAKDVKGKEKATDLDLFLEKLGVGNIAQGLTADKVFEELRSDQRTAIAHSLVTGKVRRVDLFHSLSGRETTGWVAITHDWKDANIDVKTNPIMNLLRVDTDAFEVIAEGPDGELVYALFNDKEALLDEADGTVVADSTIPRPYTQRLQSAISCVRCHGTDGSDGWKDLPNDVKTLLQHGFTPFGDLTALEQTVPDVRARIQGLYGGSFAKQLQRARDDHAEVVLRESGILWKDDVGQTQTVRYSSRQIADRYTYANFSTVDAERALRDLGLKAPSGKALQTLQELLPPDPDAVVGLDRPEDPRLALLLSGVSIGVRDWGLVYSFALTRSQKSLAAVLEGRNGR